MAAKRRVVASHHVLSTKVQRARLVRVPNPISDLRHRFAPLAAALATSVGDLFAQRERGVTARAGGETRETRAADGVKGETDLQAPKAELEVILGAARHVGIAGVRRRGEFTHRARTVRRVEGAREARRSVRCAGGNEWVVEGIGLSAATGARGVPVSIANCG